MRPHEPDGYGAVPSHQVDHLLTLDFQADQVMLPDDPEQPSATSHADALALAGVVDGRPTVLMVLSVLSSAAAEGP